MSQDKRPQGQSPLGQRDGRRLGIRPIPQGLQLSVIMPVYNERNTIREIIRRVRQVDLPLEVLVVDDGSTDGTTEVLAELAAQGDLRLLRHDRNRGKGAALRTGFLEAIGDMVLVQDADLEYDPAHYRRLIQPIMEGTADVVYGSRFLPAGPRQGHSCWHYIGNRLLTALSNLLTGLNLTDMETGAKVFRSEVVAAIAPTLQQDGFGIDPELTAKIARRKYRVHELGISYSGRTYAEGKKIGLRDAVQVVWGIVRYGISD